MQRMLQETLERSVIYNTMVREVEAYNSTEILQTGLSLDAEQYPNIITGVLSNDGITLTLKVNRELAAGCARKLSLSYILPHYEQQLVAEYLLGAFGPDDTVDETEEYEFNLGPVMTEILHDAPEQLADDTISIRFYSYEANTPFNFGDCYPQWDVNQAYVVDDYVQYGDRLWRAIRDNTGQVPPNATYWVTTGVPSSGTAYINLPYTVSYPGTAVMPQSTDGWYVLRVVDAEVYDNGSAYLIDDIVFYNDELYICIQNTAGGNNPTDDDYWTILSTEEETNLYTFGPMATATVPTVLNTNLLVTRYVKQKHIYELLAKTSYKKYDDLRVVSQLEKIMSMREAAVVYLKLNDPVRARRMLDDITIQVNSFTTNVGERTTIETITNFTL